MDRITSFPLSAGVPNCASEGDSDPARIEIKTLVQDLELGHIVDAEYAAMLNDGWEMMTEQLNTTVEPSAIYHAGYVVRHYRLVTLFRLVEDDAPESVADVDEPFPLEVPDYVALAKARAAADMTDADEDDQADVETKSDADDETVESVPTAPLNFAKALLSGAYTVVELKQMGEQEAEAAGLDLAWERQENRAGERWESLVNHLPVRS